MNSSGMINVPAGNRTRARNLVSTVLAMAALLLCVGSGQADTPNAVIFEHPELRKRLDAASDYRIVVMPMQNLSLNENVAVVFRQRIQEQLRNLGYSVVDDEILDRKLEELGVTHAGQLSYVSMEVLNKMVGADAYLYGVVEQAAKQHTIVYNAFAYSCSLQMHDRTGEIVWSAQQERIAKRRFSLDPFNALLDPMLVSKAGKIDKAAQALADRMLTQFPRGPVQVQYEDPLLDRAIEIEVEEN